MEVCDKVCDDQTSWENSEEMCLSTFFQENKMSYGYKGESVRVSQCLHNQINSIDCSCN